MELLRDLLVFVRAHRRRWWLVPVIVVLLWLAALLVLAGVSAVSPFIYTLY